MKEIKPFDWRIPVYKDGNAYGIYRISDGKDVLAGGDSDCNAITERGINQRNRSVDEINKEKSESVLSEYLENLFEPIGENNERVIAEGFYIRYSVQ